MRQTALLLCLLVLASALLSACASGDAGAAQTSDTKDGAVSTAAASAAETTAAETDRRSAKDNLPADLNFGGYTVNILLRAVDGIIRNEIYVNEQTGDVLNDAVFARNSSVQERLNVKFKYEEKGKASAADFPKEVTTSILAGDDAYSLIAWGQAKTLLTVKDKLFLNLSGAKYLELDKPWWNMDYMRSLMPGGEKTYFLVGDLSLVTIARMSAMFFNQNMYSSFNGPVDKLYETVRSGGWTVDLLSKYVTSAYGDLNGDGVTNEGDRFGMITTSVALADHFAFTSGMTVTSVGKDGVPKLDVDKDRTAKLFDKLGALYYSNKGTFVSTDTEINNGGNAARFASEKTLFLPYWFEAADLLRDMEADFGIIPFPKLDESQEDYRALVQNSNTVFCLPVTCGKPDYVCAVLEAMGAENYRTVLTAYYDSTLKNKYSRGAATVEMIDLIHDSVITDFGYAYSGLLSSIGTIARTLLKNDGAQFASTYASTESQVLASFADLIANY